MFTSILKDTMAADNWQSVQKAGEEKQFVLFPIGVIEEHGPHLPLGADIYWSYSICRMVKEKLMHKGRKSVIVPPYYWGVNYCTGEFPGSFSLQPETMQKVLFEIFENLERFGFSNIYCFNYHGDAVHVRAIAEAIQKANRKRKICVRLVVEAIDLPLYGWQGNESFLLVLEPKYKAEWFEEETALEQGLYDIHAGAFETAVMNVVCAKQVDLKKARELASTSLNEEGMKKWLQGGEAAKEVVPLGYAGNPAGYEAVSKHVEEMLDLQVADIVSKMLKDTVTNQKEESKMRIETKRLLITEFDLSMAENVHKNSLDEDTRRFVPDEVFETVDEARETIEFLMGCYESGEGPLVYPVLLQDSTNIGYVQLVPIEEGVEVGYHIAKEFTGNGYASEALEAFLEHMQVVKHIKKVYGICVSQNVASKRVLEKCGFKKDYEGPGEYQDRTTEIAKYSKEYHA